MLFRVAGKRSLAQITTFDFVLLLIVAEATQQGLLGDDFSVTNAFLVVGTLVAADVGFSLVKARSGRIDKLVDSVPVILVDGGKVLKDRLDRSRVSEDDILTAARQLHGLERLEQVKYAVLERSGGISIVPK